MNLYKHKYLKYRNKYLALKNQIGGDHISMWIDIYRFKIFNYSNNTEGEIKFGSLSKTTDINKGYVKSESNIPDITDGLYSVDYIKSNNISSKYYSYYKDNPAKRDRENKSTHDSEYIDTFRNNITNTSKILLDHLIKLKAPLDQITNECGYIKKIYINPNEKIIVFGDYHGSFHSFFRNMLRLHMMGVLDINTFKINDNFRLIFLGDIVDRGRYCIEILDMLFQFICNNPIDRIIINRGNHEDVGLSSLYGFKSEVLEKTNDESIFTNIMKLFSYCSSAVILVNNGKKYWLCHGLVDSSDNIIAFINNDAIILPLTADQTFNIRWTDTPAITTQGAILSLSKTTKISGHIRPQIGVDDLNKMFGYLDFIIRGHEDHLSNSWLLKKSYNFKSHMGTDYIEKTDKFNIHKNRILKDHMDKNIPIINGIMIDGPVQTVNNTNHPDYFNLMTISTNTDLGRTLTSDSFIVMRFNNDMISRVSGANLQNLDWLH
jgi:hypothetical protein